MRTVRFRLRLIPSLMLACLGGCHARPPALDHASLLSGQSWWDNRDWDWYRANIPFFDSPDSTINATYYYRWEVVTKHRTYGAPETGYTFSEFIDRPFWSGADGAISCPLGHQMYEVRWLRDRRYVEDFARYWFETPGAQPRSYSNWYGDAVWASYLVTGDSAFLHAMLPHMKAQYAGWMAEHWDSTHQMFRWDGMHDGMETNINSRQTTDPFAGAEGYRPTLNSYLFADARAIGLTAALFGDTSDARLFAGRADRLKHRVQQELWDPGRQFFVHQAARDEKGGIRAGDLTYASGPYAGSAHGRELIGYVPWQFSLPDSGYEAAWRFLMDTSYFLSPRGPTTVEQHDPQFFVSPTCCVWSGNEWPYATSQTLTAMANLLNDYRQDVVGRQDFARLLHLYALDQRKDGRPYVAEAADPYSGSWKGHDTPYHSEHYFHSSFADLVITGLAGLRPRADDSVEVNPLIPDGWDWFGLDNIRYHDRELAIFWDRTGRHYGRGAGLSVYADGHRVAHRESLGRVIGRMGPVAPLRTVDRPVDFAVNNGRGPFPAITASYSAPSTPPQYLIDGQSWYAAQPPDRWTASGSGQGEDTVTIDLGVPRPIEWVSLYFLDDGDSIRVPARYVLQAWRGGTWSPLDDEHREPPTPTGHRATTVSFTRTTTSRLRLIVVHQAGASSGLTEIEAWGHAPLPLPAPTESPANVAAHEAGDSFPRVQASYTAPGTDPARVIDSRVAYTRYSANRWSARGTPHRRDWLEVDFGGPRRVGRVDVHFVAGGRDLLAPESWAVQYWTGTRWREVAIRRRQPAGPPAPGMNSAWLAPVTTSRVRVEMTHRKPAASAVTELLIWEDGP